MASTFERCTEMIIRQVFEESEGELSSRSPLVMSCGGIYIPHSSVHNRMLQQILVTPNEKEPVKIMTQAPQRNILKHLMARESMN